MDQKTFSVVAGVVFAVVALLHLRRWWPRFFRVETVRARRTLKSRTRHGIFACTRGTEESFRADGAERVATGDAVVLHRSIRGTSFDCRCARPDRIPAAAARSRSSTEQLECGRVFVTSFDCSRRL